MTENKCKSLENLLSTAAVKLLPTQFQSYRDELHRKYLKLSWIDKELIELDRWNGETMAHSHP